MAGPWLPLLGVALVCSAAAYSRWASSQSVHVLQDEDSPKPTNLCDDTGLKLPSEGYKKETLGGPLFNITIWLPRTGQSEKVFYENSRFDWSTQIGAVCIGPLVVFPDPYWRGPPNTADPDTGVGLASEFGCDEEGDTCDDRGLNDMDPSANGVLGWNDDDLNAEEVVKFVKIGVGRLMKPNVSEGEEKAKYNPRTRYEVDVNDLGNAPTWAVRYPDENSVDMSQSVELVATNTTNYSYDLATTVKVTKQTETVGSIQITTTLRNTGSATIRTPHYSRNFMTIKNNEKRRKDDNVDANWSVELESIDVNDIKSTNKTVFNGLILPKAEESGGVRSEYLDVVRTLVNVTKVIKTEFLGPNETDASTGWTATHKDNNITIKSETTTNNTQELYRYLLYASKDELAPVPMRMLDLAPGATATMVRTLTFEYEPGVEAEIVWVAEGWMLGTAIGLMLGSTVVSLQCKKKAMVFMDTFLDKRPSVNV